jgi:tripartite-type tricarboxylate transporter receptor subunit TctC
MNRNPRRRAVGSLGALAGATLMSASLAPAHAQTAAWPSKPIRIIVPYPPGGVGDTFTRSLAQQLSERLGQPVLIDNKPGASQIIGAEAAAKAAPDGYTLFLGSVTSLAINVRSMKRLPYDPLKDFAPIAMCFGTPLYLVVNPSVPAKNVTELIALARARPGQLSFASIGQGGSLHLAGELFKSMAGVDMTHVAYKGSAPALADVIAGQVNLIFDPGVSSLPHVKTGKLRALAITSSRRSDSTPDIPTIAESGVPGYEASIWFGLVAPAGTPAPIVSRLSAEVNQIVRSAGMRERFNPFGLDLMGGTPEEFAATIRSEIPKWGKVLQDAKVEPE